MSSCSIINPFYHLIYPSSRKVEEQWSFKMMSLLNMTESGCADQSKNGYFQSQEKQASTSELLRRTCRRKQSPSIWEPLMKKKEVIPRLELEYRNCSMQKPSSLGDQQL